MSEERLIIVGSGGLGREVQEVIEDLNSAACRYVIEGFLDSNASVHGQLVNSLPVLGDIEDAQDFPGHGYVVAIGNPKVRARIVESLRGIGIENFPSIVHPTAQISRRASLGQGSIVRSGASIQTGAHVGAFSSLSQYCVIGHDCVIDDYLSIAPHACIVGGGKLGKGVNVGTGASVVFPATVGDWCTIGAGAVVTKDLPDGVTAVGVPAKVIKSNASL